MFFLQFAAIRLAVLEELDEDEDVIFNQQPRPPKTEWTLDTDNINPEDMQQYHGHWRTSKVAGNGQSDVAFSSPLVG